MCMALSATHHFSRSGHLEILEIEDDDLDTSNLHTHILSDHAKRRLLADQQSLTPPTVDTETLLQGLEKLAPSVARTFVPKNTTKDALIFRLINDTSIVGEEESYIALSYCWKEVNHDAPRKEVSPVGDLPFGWIKTVEELPLPTSRAMFEAALRERRNEGEGLWYDQVCINQEDEIEKANAIGAIDLIYKNARTVVVALDDIAAEEEEVVFLQQYLEVYSASELPVNRHPDQGLERPFMEQHPVLRSFFERVLSSIWFERAWCAHEMRVATSHVFMVPCISNDDDEPYTFVRFTGAFFLHMLVLASELGYGPTLTFQIRSLLELFSHLGLQEQYSVVASFSPDTKLPPLPNLPPPSYVSLISDIFAMKAGGNPLLPENLRRLDANRDKTSIVLNSSGLPLALRTASTLQRPCLEEECLRQLLLVFLAARDPVALCTTGPPLHLHDGSISWLCRPAPQEVPTHNKFELRISTSQEGEIVQASDGRAEYVQLGLAFLDLPHRVHPNPNFTSYVQKARTLIDLAIQYGIQSSSTWNSWQKSSHLRALAMKNIFVQTLACCFDCGPKWVVNVSASIQPANQALPVQTAETLFHPHLIAESYILTPNGQSAWSLLLCFISTLIEKGIPWASGANETTHGPLIVASPPPPPPPPSSSSQTSPLPLSLDEGRALIFAPYAYSKQLLVAVPEVIKGTEYASLARGWILTPMNTYTNMGGVDRQIVSWTMQSKGVVFGDRGFNESLGRRDRAGVARRHRVFGPGML